MIITAPASRDLFKGDWAKSIIDHSDFIEGRPFLIDNTMGTERLFHYDEIEPAHKLYDSDFKKIEELVFNKKDLKIISFHCAYCTNSKRLASKKPRNVWEKKYSKSYTRDELYSNFKKNISKIKKITGSDIEILIENNGYHTDAIHRDVTDAGFLYSLVSDNNIGFLLDLAHAKVTCSQRGLDYDTYINELPLHKCRQIHISKVDESNKPLVDSHLAPDEKEFTEALDLSKRFPSIDYITIEFYKDISGLIKSLSDLRSLINNDRP